MSREASAPRSPWLESFVRRQLDLFRGRGGFVLATIAALIGTASNAPGLEMLIVASIVFAVLGLAFELRLRPRYNELLLQVEQEKSTAKAAARALQSALEAQLRKLAEFCEINQSHHRVSIYCHVGEEFVMLARESTNMSLRKPGRGVYPSDMGVIGQAWNVGETFRSRWPEDRDEWNEFQSTEYGLALQEVAALSMHTRSVGAKRLEQGSMKVGVLVIESTEPQGVRKSHLTKAEESMLLRSICEILAVSQPQFPAVAEYQRSHALVHAGA